jgi:Family of unknown function (DUF5994)
MAYPSPANASSGPTPARGQVRIMTATVILPAPPVLPIKALNIADLTELVGLPESAARILLKPLSEHPGMVNGAWWPRSRDLARELPLLVAALDGIWGQIYHATVQVDMWPDIPGKVRAGRHIVRIGWYDTEQDPHDICLLSVPGRGRWDLLVVPPELDPAIAARLMATAASPGNMQTATSLLATASAASTPVPPVPPVSPVSPVPPAASAASAGILRDAERITAWESEGGTPPVRA